MPESKLPEPKPEKDKPHPRDLLKTDPLSDILSALSPGAAKEVRDLRDALSRPTGPQVTTAYPQADASFLPFLSQLCQGLDAVSSSLRLIAPSTPRPLRERLGLELADMEARRILCGAQSLRVLLEQPALSVRDLRLDEIVATACREWESQFKLARVKVTADLGCLPTFAGDRALISLAISSAVWAVLASLEAAGANAPAMNFRTRNSISHVRLDISQNAGPISGAPIERQFDLNWIDRPGGVFEAIALTAARRIAQMHGGQMEARLTEAGMFQISLVIPLAHF